MNIQSVQKAIQDYLGHVSLPKVNGNRTPVKISAVALLIFGAMLAFSKAIYSLAGRCSKNLPQENLSQAKTDIREAETATQVESKQQKSIFEGITFSEAHSIGPDGTSALLNAEAIAECSKDQAENGPYPEMKNMIKGINPGELIFPSIHKDWISLDMVHLAILSSPNGDHLFVVVPHLPSKNQFTPHTKNKTGLDENGQRKTFTHEEFNPKAGHRRLFYNHGRFAKIHLGCCVDPAKITFQFNRSMASSSSRALVNNFRHLPRHHECSLDFGGLCTSEKKKR